jgi:hypothetical protein
MAVIWPRLWPAAVLACDLSAGAAPARAAILRFSFAPHPTDSLLTPSALEPFGAFDPIGSMPFSVDCSAALLGGGLALTLQLLQPTPLRMELLRAAAPAAMAQQQLAPSLPPQPLPHAPSTPTPRADER